MEYGPDLHLRRLDDGSEFRVVKVMYEPDELQSLIEAEGWRADIQSARLVRVRFRRTRVNTISGCRRASRSATGSPGYARPCDVAGVQQPGVKQHGGRRLPSVRGLAVEAVEAAAAMIGREEVTARWDDPSALAGMTVGARCAHLVRAVGSVSAYLDRTDPAARPTAPCSRR